MKPSSLLAWLAIGFVVLAIHPIAAQTAADTNQAKLAQRDQLRLEAIKAAQEGKLNEATDLLNQVYAIEESVFGAVDSELVRTLGGLAQVAELKQDDHALIDIRKRQHRVAEQLYGQSDYRTQDANRAITAAEQSATRSPEDRTRLQQAVEMNAELVKRFGEHDFAGAISLAEQVAEIRKQVLGEQHPEYATSLNNLAMLYAETYGQTINDPRAESSYRKAIEIYKQVFGEQHPEYANILNNLAMLYETRLDIPRAEPLYRQATEIYKQVLGEQHPSYATSLNNLAALYKAKDEFYALMEPLYRQATEIHRQVLGEQHPSYATGLKQLAGTYQAAGDYARAALLYRQSIEIEKQVLGEQHPNYFGSLDNLAYLYVAMGDYARAEPLYRQAMELRKAVLGEQHPNNLGSLGSLSDLYIRMGDYARAEPLLRQQMEFRRQLAGGHPGNDYGTFLNNLATFYQAMGDYDRAEPRYSQAIEFRKNRLGEQHPDYATSLDNLAGLYKAKGDYARAEPMYRQAIEIRKAAHSEQHPIYGASLNNLGALYVSMGDYARAEPLYRQATEITTKNMELTADGQSQSLQILMGDNLRYQFDNYLLLPTSLRYQLDNYLSLTTRDPRFQADAYTALLRWKGCMWRRQRRQRLLIDQPELKPRITAFESFSSRLSGRILHSRYEPSWNQQRDELADEREKLERDLSLASVTFRQIQQPVTPDQLRESLPEGTILLDFLEYNHFTPADQEQQIKGTSQRHLSVHLVGADQNVQAIDLGDSVSLVAFVQTWRKDLGQSAEAATAAGELRKRIWLPIEKHLEGITAVYVSPNGLLGQFPLAALPGKQPGSFLIEELAITILPIPHGLPEMAVSTKPFADPSENRFCLIGGVDYGPLHASETPSTPSPPVTSAGTLMLAAHGGQWQTFSSLQGTNAQIDTIESLIRKHRPSSEIKILRGDFATETAFAQTAPQNRYLHVATHGFFSPETVQNAMTASTPYRAWAENESGTRSVIGEPNVKGQHPDLLSGLVFAGANHASEANRDDGILTAAEVQSLDLRNVELAVLSACDTGLGKTAGGEGIIGLQRAFQLAGAKTTITSLWQVDAAATQALMVEFYRNLFERKLSKLESLRRAQLWLLNNPDAIEGRDLATRGQVRETKAITTEAKTASDKPTRSLPAYWAAFQLSGDPR